jgi:hypothetical protein
MGVGRIRRKVSGIGRLHGLQGIEMFLLSLLVKLEESQAKIHIISAYNVALPLQPNAFVFCL